MAQTQAERIIATLLHLGFREVETRSTKFRTFTYAADNPRLMFWLQGRRLFVGKKGSFRIGNKLTDSFPVHKKTKNAILNDSRSFENGSV